jgi:hypothetical protein
MLEGLSVIKIDGTKDPHDLFYVVIKTAERKRAAQIQDAIQHWNSECPASKIILQPITPFPPICTFGKSLNSSYNNHIIVKQILEDKAKKAAGSESNYFSSNRAKLFKEHQYSALQIQHQEPNEEHEYDVVKKKRTINNANAMVGADITSVLLGEEAGYFYDFSSAVLQALTAVSTLEGEIFNEEARWMQNDQQCMNRTRIGYAYAAFNTCLGTPTPIKMGATMKDSPFPRLKELSRCLPQSFELLACVPSTDPFAVEKLVHAHFEQFRIKRRSTGRTTEFFMVSKDVVYKFFADLNQELLLPV